MEIYPILKSRQRRQPSRVTNRYDRQRGLAASIGRLRRLKQDLAVTSEIFSQEQVWPDQCDYIIQKFDGMRKATDRFIEHVNSKSGQVEPIAAKRYSILADACFFSDQVEKVYDLTREFGVNSQRPNARKFKLKQINTCLHQLHVSFNKLIKGVDDLFEDL